MDTSKCREKLHEIVYKVRVKREQGKHRKPGGFFDCSCRIYSSEVNSVPEEVEER